MNDELCYLKKKGSERIQINSLLLTISLGILSVVLLASKEQCSQVVIAELAVSIPLFKISSLAYTKLRYRPEIELRTWDFYGWITHSIAYVCVFCSFGMILFQNGHKSLAEVFFAVEIFTYFTYCLLDIYLEKSRAKTSTVKFLFHLLMFLIAGGIPIIVVF